MDDAVDGRVLGKDLVQRLLVGDVGLVKVGAAAGQQLDPVNGNLGRVVETVDNDDIVAGVEQGQSRERADVARATADWAQRSMLVQRCRAKQNKTSIMATTRLRPAPTNASWRDPRESCVGQRGAISAHICWAGGSIAEQSMAEQRMEGGRTR